MMEVIEDLSMEGSNRSKYFDFLLLLDLLMYVCLFSHNLLNNKKIDP